MAVVSESSNGDKLTNKFFSELSLQVITAQCLRHTRVTMVNHKLTNLTVVRIILWNREFEAGIASNRHSLSDGESLPRDCTNRLSIQEKGPSGS